MSAQSENPVTLLSAEIQGDIDALASETAPSLAHLKAIIGTALSQSPHEPLFATRTVALAALRLDRDRAIALLHAASIVIGGHEEEDRRARMWLLRARDLVLDTLTANALAAVER